LSIEGANELNRILSEEYVNVNPDPNHDVKTLDMILYILTDLLKNKPKIVETMNV